MTIEEQVTKLITTIRTDAIRTVAKLVQVIRQNPTQGNFAVAIGSTRVGPWSSIANAELLADQIRNAILMLGTV